MDTAPSLAADLWRPVHREASSVLTDRSNGSRGVGRRRSHSDAASQEEDPYKIVSTSGDGAGQELVRLLVLAPLASPVSCSCGR
jgi:hypothetical protein